MSDQPRTYAEVCREAAKRIDDQHAINTTYYPAHQRDSLLFTDRLRALADLLDTISPRVIQELVSERWIGLPALLEVLISPLHETWDQSKFRTGQAYVLDVQDGVITGISPVTDADA